MNGTKIKSPSVSFNKELWWSHLQKWVHKKTQVKLNARWEKGASFSFGSIVAFFPSLLAPCWMFSRAGFFAPDHRGKKFPRWTRKKIEGSLKKTRHRKNLLCSRIAKRFAAFLWVIAREEGSMLQWKSLYKIGRTSKERKEVRCRRWPVYPDQFLSSLRMCYMKSKVASNVSGSTWYV